MQMTVTMTTNQNIQFSVSVEKRTGKKDTKPISHLKFVSPLAADLSNGCKSRLYSLLSNLYLLSLFHPLLQIQAQAQQWLRRKNEDVESSALEPFYDLIARVMNQQREIFRLSSEELIDKSWNDGENSKQLFLKMGQPRPLFGLFSSFRTENLSSQYDSNSDHRSRRQERWPLDHHHGPNLSSLPSVGPKGLAIMDKMSTCRARGSGFNTDNIRMIFLSLKAPGGRDKMEPISKEQGGALLHFNAECNS